jgi:trimethylamine--corrinoid protein Co-methyltransferase
MLSAERVSSRPSGYRLLSDAQLETVHHAALEILRRTGVRVDDKEALELLRDAGCVVDNGGRVRFPPAVVESALERAPSRIVLCDRSGAPALYLEAHRTYFGTGSDLPYTIDLDTGERRPSLLSDVEQTARLVDSLPEVDFVMSMAQASDVAAATSDRKSFLAMVANTCKPIVFTAWDEKGLDDIVRMSELIAGGRDELAMKPFLLAYLEPTSPLQHSDVVLRKLLLMADRGLPFVYAPGPIEGASAPMRSSSVRAVARSTCAPP